MGILGKGKADCTDTTSVTAVKTLFAHGARKRSLSIDVMCYRLNGVNNLRDESREVFACSAVSCFCPLSPALSPCDARRTAIYAVVPQSDVGLSILISRGFDPDCARACV